MIVADAMVELLAMTLYINDFDRYPPVAVLPWGKLPDEDREPYRRMARGERAFGSGPDELAQAAVRQTNEDLEL